jgi:hypothetical protein
VAAELGPAAPGVTVRAITRDVGVARLTVGSLMFFLRSRIALVLALALGLVAHLSLARPIYSVYDRVLAWVVLVAAVTLLWRFIRRDVKSVPVLEIAVLELYAFYAMPQFSQDKIDLLWGPYRPSAIGLATATTLVACGTIALMAGFGLGRRVGGRRRSFFDAFYPLPTPAWKAALLLYTVPAFAVYGLVALRPDYIPVSIRFLVGQLFNVYLAQILLLYLGFVHRQKSLLRAAYILIAAMAGVGFVQGMLGNVVFPVLVLFVAAWIWGNAFRARWLVIGALAIVVINPVKNEFRLVAFEDKDVSTLGKVERRLENWATAFEHVWGGGATTESNVMETASRMDELLPIALTVETVPAYLPYNVGRGMGEAFLYWMPRLLWPAKPLSTDLLLNRFAIKFGLADYDLVQKSTSSTSIFSEAYWNFGVPGVLAFLFAAGMLLGMLFGRNGPGQRVAMLVAMVYLATKVVLVEALTGTISGLVAFLVGTFLAMRLLASSSGLLRRSAP